jgi:hypothetical protein
MENMIENNKKTDHPFGSRCAFAQRDYLRYPSGPEDMYLMDFRHEELINLADPNYLSKMERYTNECFRHQQDQQVSPTFHGVHVISRRAYSLLGGFSELYSGRSFADDHMTKRGTLLARKIAASETLPPKFSIAWTGQGEYLPHRFTYQSLEEHKKLLREFDSFDHPIPGATGWVYIHHKFSDSAYLHTLNTQLEKYLYEMPPRFT